MKKSLFAKYFTVCAVIILSSLVFLGGIFSLFVSKYLRNERQQTLSENVSKAVSFTVYNYDLTNGNYLEKRTLRQFYSSLADVTNGTMFLTDTDGNTLICTEEGVCTHELSKIPANILKTMQSGNEYREYGMFGKLYDSMHYTVGRAVLVNNNSRAIGYLFSSTSADSVSSLISDFVKMFLLAAFFSLLISSIIIYAFTAMLSRPLKEMSLAAKSFGKGDFTTRISYRREDEIGELAKSFNQMADSLSELETMRRNFIANVSHELKTPMTTIGGFIDGILDGTIPKDKQEHYMHLVSDEVKRLSRLVRSMLSIAKIESGDMSLNATAFNITDTVFSTLFIFEKNINEKNIEIRGLEEIEKTMVVGDEDLIHQVVYNLIDNAVKFCDENGYLEFIFLKEYDRVKIHVKNSGKGLSKEDLNRVFDRFYKTDKSRGLDKNGVGLGLYIVKTILDLHSSEITVGSVEGQYTEFIFSLPLNIEPKDKSSYERHFLKK